MTPGTNAASLNTSWTLPARGREAWSWSLIGNQDCWVGYCEEGSRLSKQNARAGENYQDNNGVPPDPRGV